MIHVDNALWLLMEKDPSLNPYAGEIRMHLDRFNDRRWHLNGLEPLSDFANGHHYFGFHRTETGWVFREWLPGADAVWLKGDFNDWEPYDHPLTNIGGGVWEIDAKMRDYTLVGADYRTPVSYWMPFNGNVGIHDLKARGLKKVCIAFDMDLYNNPNVYKAYCNIRDLLRDADVSFSKYEWPQQYKGFDDYLNAFRKGEIS